VRRLRVFGAAAVAVFLGALATSQPAPRDLQIDDMGAVIPQHQSVHVKNKQVLRWRRSNTGSWHVVFRTESPCQNGILQFGSAGGRPQTCTISVCTRPNDPSCKSYKYSSATAPNATLHDPEIIVDN
jgi:hypothetical protein